MAERCAFCLSYPPHQVHWAFSGVFNAPRPVVIMDGVRVVTVARHWAPGIYQGGATIDLNTLAVLERGTIVR